MAINSEMIVVTGARLRQAQPQLWDDFVRAMQSYSTQQAMQMVTAQPEFLNRAQGMAMATQEITLILNSVMSSYEALMKHKSQKAGQR